jgi:hypothetical protein
MREFTRPIRQIYPVAFLALEVLARHSFSGTVELENELAAIPNSTAGYKPVYLIPARLLTWQHKAP